MIYAFLFTTRKFSSARRTYGGEKWPVFKVTNPTLTEEFGGEGMVAREKYTGEMLGYWDPPPHYIAGMGSGCSVDGGVGGTILAEKTLRSELVNR
jgi:hypothetical protein